jgi:hypothetical protein
MLSNLLSQRIHRSAIKVSAAVIARSTRIARVLQVDCIGDVKQYEGKIVHGIVERKVGRPDMVRPEQCAPFGRVGRLTLPT